MIQKDPSPPRSAVRGILIGLPISLLIWGVIAAGLYFLGVGR